MKKKKKNCSHSFQLNGLKAKSGLDATQSKDSSIFLF